jgi:uncharacterized protein YbaR (Trm112 family)
MQKPYDRKKELICVIYCPNCKKAVAACKESAVNVTGEGGDLYSPQSFNEQAAFYVARGYKKGKVTEGEFLTVCKCKKQNT